MQETPEFQISRNRDAWGAVRGFVYQVQQTILRWLELPIDSVLEPEHGEDLDVVMGALTPGADAVRILEQIKYRERDVTLNSPEIRAALAGFYEHCRSNPTLDLRFRFMTNAEARRERPSLFPDRTPGIVAWNSVALGQVTDRNEVLAQLLAIQQTFADAPCPDEYPAAEWSQFQNFIKNPDAAAIEAFVRRVEVKCGEPEPRDLTDKVRAILVASGRCPEQDEAQAAYERLFCFVFDVLARPGPRRLTAADLNAAIRGHLTAAHQVLISQVRTIAELTASLQPRVEGLEARLATATLQVQLLGSDIRLASALDVVTEAPPQPILLASRREGLAELKSQLDAHTFVAMHGLPGSGKTQLARMAAQMFSIRAWIGLTGFDAARAAAYVALTRSKLTPSAESLAKHEIIVVDDIPPFTAGSTLSTALAAIHRDTRAKVLCVSEHRILPSIGRQMFASPPGEFACPALSDEDITELLQQAGAPPEAATARLVAFFAGITHRNILLFVALLAHLERLEWRVDENAIAALIAGEFTQGLAPTVSEHLFRSVPDDRSRELLHRVRLATGPISENELAGICAVRVAITEPLLRIAPLDGVWVQRDPSRRISISPLMRALPNATLSPDTVEECHALFADALLAPQGISPTDVQRALFHLQNAARWKRYDQLLVAALGSAIMNRQMPGAAYLLDALSRYPLSPRASDERKLAVCSFQLAAVEGRGPRAPKLLADLTALMSGRSMPDIHVASAAALAVQYTEGSKQLALVRQMIRAIGEGELDGPSPWRQLLIYVGMKLDSDEDGRAWLQTFLDLPPLQRERLLDEEPLLASIIVHTCTAVHVRAGDTDALTIQPALQELDELRAMGRIHRVPLLECAAAGVMIVVLRDVAKDEQGANIVATSALSVAAEDHRGRFLVYSSIGLAAKCDSDKRQAVIAYKEAFAGSFSGVEYDALWAAMLAAEAANDDPAQASRFLEHGLVAAGREDVCTPLLRTKVLLELGLARWLAGADTWHLPFLEGVELLLTIRDDSKEWRSVVVRLTHCVGFIGTYVRHGTTLQTVSDGSPYTKPFIGIFRATDKGAATRYTAEREIAGAANAAALAHHFGDNARAVRLSRHCVGIAYDRSDAVSAAGLANIFAYLLADDLVEDVLAAAFEIGHRAGPPPSQEQDDDEWRPGDRSVALFGFLPLVLWVSNRLTESRDAGLAAIDRAANALLRIDLDPRSGKPWRPVVEVFRTCCDGKQQPEHDSQSIKRITGWAAAVLQHGCLLLTSVHPRATASDAAHVQALTLPTIWKLLERDEISQERLLTGFLQRYWQHKVENDPYRFSAPAVAAQRLTEASRIPETSARLAMILETVWDAVSATVPAQTRAWLRELRTTPPKPPVDG